MTCSWHAAIAVAMFSVAAVSPAARGEDELKKDLEGVQGVWERSAAELAQAGTTRITKEVRGDVETLTTYGEGGRVLGRQRNPFKLVSEGDVRLWTFNSIEVTEGPRKGFKTPAGFSGSYIYRLDGDTLYEVQGLLGVDRTRGLKPSIFVWKRVKKAG